ncbi:MAG TPA: MFS transporter [Pseudolysinimonas sp.]|nr:MFS transporter [Pseudolysinimonas sp.]
MRALGVAVRSPWRGRILAFVGIVLVALSLRTAVSAVSPILNQVSHEIPLSALIVSLLGAVPPVAFAVSGLLAPAISRRVGLDRTLLLAIGVMVLGHLGRALAPSSGALLGATVVTLLGVGVANVLLPPIVKRYFPDRLSTVSAIYITVMSFGSAVPALVAVPVSDAAGWRVSLGVWFVIAATAAIPWIGMLRRERRARLLDTPTDTELEPPQPALLGRMPRSLIAWALVGSFGAAAFVSYATFAWLPPILVETAGLSRTAAGSLLALWAIMGIPNGILAPMLAARLKNLIPVLLAAVILMLGGYGGLLLAPAAAPALWVVLGGLSTLLFPLVLALINLRTRTHEGAVALSGFVQGLAYAIGVAGPIVIGLVHDATRGWGVPLVVLIVVGLLLEAPALFVLARPRFVEDELGVAPTAS